MLMFLLLFCFRYLKPDIEKKSKHKTSVMKRTLNPEFNEVRPPQLLPSAERQRAPPSHSSAVNKLAPFTSAVKVSFISGPARRRRRWRMNLLHVVFLSEEITRVSPTSADERPTALLWH